MNENNLFIDIGILPIFSPHEMYIRVSVHELIATCISEVHEESE